MVFAAVIFMWIIFYVIISTKIFFFCINRWPQSKIDCLKFVFASLANCLTADRRIVLRCFFLHIHIVIIFIFIFRYKMNPVWTCIGNKCWNINTWQLRSIVFFVFFSVIWGTGVSVLVTTAILYMWLYIVYVWFPIIYSP